MLISEVAKKLNISKRTIRYYEQLGLIQVSVNQENGYRSYSEEQLKQLRQAVYYRALHISLKDIQTLLTASEHEVCQLLQHHLHQLEMEQQQLASIIEQVKETIRTMEDEQMKKHFEQQKLEWIKGNEAQFGEELRQRHGEESVMASYGKLKDMTEAQYMAAEQLQKTLFERLEEAMEEESQELLLEIAELHKRWLSFYWPKYTTKAHVGLVQMYVADERFTRYYDERAGDGATQLLLEAVLLYSEQ